MEKTSLKIRVYGDPVLRKKAASVKRVTAERRQILSQMAQLMYDSSGIGLAAPQAGISESMIVVDIGSGLYKLINPKIIKKEGFQVTQEGCLSVPGISINVRRAKKIVVEALDQSGKPLFIEAQDLLACVFQHEIEHLKGKMILDYATFLQKIRFKKKLAEFKKKAKDEYRLF